MQVITGLYKPRDIGGVAKTPAGYFTIVVITSSQATGLLLGWNDTDYEIYVGNCKRCGVPTIYGN